MFNQIRTFTTNANTTLPEIKQLIKTGLTQAPPGKNNRVNILLLGIDSTQNRAHTAPLTDTMMLISIHLDSGKVHTLSLPRDLWLPEYKTKINSLYYYGLEKDEQYPEKFSQQVLSELTDVPIDFTLVLSLENVSQIVDALGGLSINVPHAFVDEQFPVDTVDITTEHDPTKLYKTIEFNTGEQVFSGERTMEYIRSRKSHDTEGTDDARTMRQRLVLQQLIAAISSKNTLFSAQKMGKLYAYYDQHFSQKIAMADVIAMAKSIYDHTGNINISLKEYALSNDEDPSSYLPGMNAGILVHPPLSQTDNQWAYTISDLKAFKNEVLVKLIQ